MSGRSVVALVCLAGEAAVGLGPYLLRRGYEVREAQAEWQGETLLSSPDLDVVVLGEGLGAGAVRDFLRRFASVPRPCFLVVRAASDLVDRVLTLELGAADIVDGPVGLRELAARIAGLLARAGRGSRDLLVLETSTVDLRAALVMHRDGREEQLSAGQIALLRLFLASPRRVLTREDIMSAAPAEAADAFDRSIDSRIVRLRRKLCTDSITTIRGAGYRFDPPGRGPE